jgi:hypothetical protein
MGMRTVTHALKDRRGVITYLYGPDESWSPRAVADVIADIDSGAHRYVVAWPEHDTDVRVVDDPDGKYLRTDRDATTRNNLDELATPPRIELDPEAAQELETSQVIESDNTSANIDEAQEARVKDPLWFLARQWQTGEFEAENGGRPAQTHVSWTSFALDRLVRGEAEDELDPMDPLDARVEAEQDQGTSPAWNSEKLEYLFGLTGAGWSLHAEEYHGRGLDWYHFDVESLPAAPSGGEKHSRRVVPASLSATGMAHPRWWRFEEDATFLEDSTDPEPNLLSMLIPEFLYIDANNWFTIPLEDAVGHLRQIESVTMVDSFGVSTTLGPVTSGGDWRLFCLSSGDADALPADLLFLPNVRGGVIEGEVIEEIAVVRDEDANVAWAVEKLYFDEDAGIPRNRADERPAEGQPDRDGNGLPDELRSLPAYRLKSSVAAHWIPYIPRLVEGQGPNPTQMYLRRARSLESASSADPQYRGKVIAESWRLNEEEAPRTGLRVQRLWRFARGSDGTAHVWIGRRKDPAMREPTSGLEFDYLERAPRGTSAGRD